MMDAHEQRMCEMQGEFFALSVKRFPCGSALFVFRFMHSDLAKQLDRIDDPYNFISPNNLIESMAIEYPSLKKERGEQISENAMKWIGYIYRAWSLIKRKESSLLYKSMKIERMAGLYDAFHTFSPEYCVDQLEHIIHENEPPALSDYEVFKQIRTQK